MNLLTLKVKYNELTGTGKIKKRQKNDLNSIFQKQSQGTKRDAKHLKHRVSSTMHANNEKTNSDTAQMYKGQTEKYYERFF